MDPTSERSGGASEEPRLPAIGSVITFPGSGGKNWVIVSRFPHPKSGEELLGLCDGRRFRYHQLSYVLRRVRQSSGDYQELIQSALERKKIRELVFQEFDSLQSDGRISTEISTNSRGVRRAIDGIFQRCADEDTPEGQTEADYIRRVREALLARFSAPPVEESSIQPIHQRLLLDGKELEFADPLSPLTANIEGKEVRLVTIRYVRQLLQGASQKTPGRNAVAHWLEESGVHPVPLKARIKFQRTVAYCDAYELQQVTAAINANTFAPEPSEGEQLPHVADDGSVMIDDPVAGFEIKYWTVEGFAKKYSLNSGILGKILGKATQEVQPLQAHTKRVQWGINNIWPEWALEEVRTLLTNEQGTICFRGNAESTEAQLSTISRVVKGGTAQRAAVIHYLEQHVATITLADICRDLGIHSDAISVVKKLRIPSGYSIRRIRLADGTGMFLYTKDAAIDERSIIVVQDSAEIRDLEPARRLSELTEKLADAKCQFIGTHTH